jgi:chromate transport protein ChrA
MIDYGLIILRMVEDPYFYSIISGICMIVSIIVFTILKVIVDDVQPSTKVYYLTMLLLVPSCLIMIASIFYTLVLLVIIYLRVNGLIKTTENDSQEPSIVEEFFP